MPFYHGSGKPLPLGTVLTGRGNAYEADWSKTDFYLILEAHRPVDCLPHKSAVFLVGDPDDIDLAGGATDWCFEVEVAGDVSKHDLNWSSEISCLLSDGHASDSEWVIAAARAYWSGQPHPDESVWEFLALSAKVIRCEPYETFDRVQPPHISPNQRYGRAP